MTWQTTTRFSKLVIDHVIDQIPLSPAKSGHKKGKQKQTKTKNFTRLTDRENPIRCNRS